MENLNQNNNELQINHNVAVQVDNNAAQLPTTPAPVKPKTPAWKTARITVDDFRRRYFLDGCRPKRRDVVRWITEGTAEGVKLAAYLLDGRYYIQIVAAESFFTACRHASAEANKPSVRRTTQETPNWRQKRNAIELREMGYKFM
ncbi:MAG: hypothetical protein IJL92_08930 [Thermoguttaceae bacterium]|nr:hypothetical protein [Thermoguttaceae bacterium]